jgi:hypothetical protein
VRFYITTPQGPFATVVGTANNTFTTRRDVTGTVLPTVPGNTVELGMKLKFEAEGEYSTTGTPTLSLGMWFGTAAGAITDQWEYTAAATVSGAAAFPWRMEWRGLVTGTLGTTTTIVGSGEVELGTSLIVFGPALPIPSTAALRTRATYDANIARAFGVCATYGVSSASNQIITYNTSLLLMN